MTLSLDTLRNVSPSWWGAVAGAAVAGAALVPSARLLAGAIGGGALLALAIKFSGPCCAECAESQQQAQQAATAQPQTFTRGAFTAQDAWAAATTQTPGECSTCGGLDAPPPPAPPTAPTSYTDRLRAAIVGASLSTVPGRA